MVLCDRCGSAEGPFDCHTTEAYRFLGKDSTTLLCCDDGAGRVTSSGRGTDPTLWFRCPGENWKNGSDGFEVETGSGLEIALLRVEGRWSGLLTMP
jgi:hypothetical protein